MTAPATTPSDPAPAPSRGGDVWHLAWAAVFLANLPLPLMLGNMVTEDGGQVGMCVCLLVVWLLGHFFVARVRGLGVVLVIGGICTALSQLFLVLHIIVGILALTIVAPPPDDSRPLTEWGGFFAALLTAGQLLVVALIGGAVLRELGRILAGGDPRMRD